MRWLGALLLLAGLYACGGGSPSPSTALVPPPVSGPHLIMYGYFGDCDGCLDQTKDHVNAASAMGFNCSNWPMPVVNRIEEMSAAGIKYGIVSSETCCGPLPQAGCITTLFDALQRAGVLSTVKMLYPVDEPETKGISDAQVSGMVNSLRQLARGYPELSDVQIGVVYGPSGPTPGLASFDSVGRDNYGMGPNYSIQLSTTQRRILLPGAADPWREDPASFVSAAESDPQVALVWVFTDLVVGGRAGVLSNGMLPAYRTAGCTLTEKCNG